MLLQTIYEIKLNGLEYLLVPIKKQKEMIKPASLSLLKQELENLSAKEVQELCLKLAKYKKDNKELLSYLIFDAGDEAEYIKNVKAEIELQFSEINTTHLYLSGRAFGKSSGQPINISVIQARNIQKLNSFFSSVQSLKIRASHSSRFRR